MHETIDVTAKRSPKNGPDSPHRDGVVVGLVGGVASGKSYAARLLEEGGAAVIDADAIAHRLLETPSVRDRIVDRFGDGVLASDGRIDRTRLSRIVFAPGADESRRDLEALVHPLVRTEIERLLREARSQGAPLIVLDVPLLLDSPLRAACDVIAYVEAPREDRLRRALDRGWSPEDFERREAAQASLADKRNAADIVIANDGTPSGLRAAIDEFVHETIRNRFGVDHG